MQQFSIVSYNVNGIRAAFNKGFVDWLKAGNFDIVCLQEIKADADQIDVAALEQLGYHCYWYSAQKKGYSGVGILTKIKPDQVVAGCGIPEYDYEGRMLRADFGNLSIFSCYFPSGTSGEARQEVKMKFLSDIQTWFSDFKKDRSVIVCGDYNIANHEIDIHDPKGNKKSSGFLPEERAWLTEWFQSGFTDSFRKVNPEKVEYSWWTYRMNARANNKGWRIDYISVSDELKDHVKAVSHLTDAVHSDHCPVWMQYEQ
ncbi:MAG: exodeoxyribonuclease III [Saprospiraceae bacterium]|nr:exodeoxyribonuclease III [Saprospiraceae bacterium]